jgi:exoribonuclease-2
MVDLNALVVYKNKPALVKEKIDGKITISLEDGEQVKVRDKDIELLHPGHVKDFREIEKLSAPESAIREAWELLSDEADSHHTIKDLASLVFGEYTPSSALGAYNILKDGLYFAGSIDKITVRGREQVAIDEAKRDEKQRDLNERSSFLERLKATLKKTSSGLAAEGSLLPDDMRFMQDVEALACGKSAKSRTMRDLGLGETPEDAHALLLNTGLWTTAVNPHPSRFGLSLTSVSICPESAGAEDRRDLCHLESFAIDSPWSNDPDDAVSFEKNADGKSVLYVHVADPASSITPGSPAEREARDRGATLYLPEGAVRMLADEALPMFALGFAEKSPALTFKMILDAHCEITETEIFPSVVKVSRLTYEEADRRIDASPALRALYELAEASFKRRNSMGAINIELPEVHIAVKNGSVDIEPVPSYRSSFLVKECMIMAGEAAGTWASGKGLAFPYISQEVELQGKVPGGIAGSWQLRRCMRARILTTKPRRHQGLGLDTYTQVTSPLRRYTDLLSHMQIRAVLRGDKPLSEDEISAHLGFSEAGTVAAIQAERATDTHWTMVYLSDKKDSSWDAVALEKKGNRWAVIIPSLALETQVALQRDVAPNDEVKLILKSVHIPKGEAVFIHS